MSNAQSSDSKSEIESAEERGGKPLNDHSDSDTSRSQHGRPSASCPLRPAFFSPQGPAPNLAFNTLDSHDRVRSLNEVPVLSTRLHSNVLWPGDESEDESSEGDYTARMARQMGRSDVKPTPGTGLLPKQDERKLNANDGEGSSSKERELSEAGHPHFPGGVSIERDIGSIHVPTSLALQVEGRDTLDLQPADVSSTQQFRVLQVGYPTSHSLHPGTHLIEPIIFDVMSADPPEPVARHRRENSVGFTSADSALRRSVERQTHTPISRTRPSSITLPLSAPSHQIVGMRAVVQEVPKGGNRVRVEHDENARYKCLWGESCGQSLSTKARAQDFFDHLSKYHSADIILPDANTRRGSVAKCRWLVDVGHNGEVRQCDSPYTEMVRYWRQHILQNRNHIWVVDEIKS